MIERGNPLFAVIRITCKGSLKEWSMIYTMLTLFPQTSTLLIKKLCCMCLRTTKQWSRWSSKAEVPLWDMFPDPRVAPESIWDQIHWHQKPTLLSPVMNGIIFWACSPSVLQFVLKSCQQERKKNQVKKESQQNCDQRWALFQGSKSSRSRNNQDRTPARVGRKTRRFNVVDMHAFKSPCRCHQHESSDQTIQFDCTKRRCTSDEQESSSLDKQGFVQRPPGCKSSIHQNEFQFDGRQRTHPNEAFWGNVLQQTTPTGSLQSDRSSTTRWIETHIISWASLSKTLLNSFGRCVNHVMMEKNFSHAQKCVERYCSKQESGTTVQSFKYLLTNSRRKKVNQLENYQQYALLEMLVPGIGRPEFQLSTQEQSQKWTQHVTKDQQGWFQFIAPTIRQNVVWEVLADWVCFKTDFASWGLKINLRKQSTSWMCFSRSYRVWDYFSG